MQHLYLVHSVKGRKMEVSGVRALRYSLTLCHPNPVSYSFGLASKQVHEVFSPAPLKNDSFSVLMNNLKFSCWERLSLNQLECRGQKGQVRAKCIFLLLGCLAKNYRLEEVAPAIYTKKKADTMEHV